MTEAGKHTPTAVWAVKACNAVKNLDRRWTHLFPPFHFCELKHTVDY